MRLPASSGLSFAPHCDRPLRVKFCREILPEDALRAFLPASGARTGWDPAWPGLAGMPGLGELRVIREDFPATLDSAAPDTDHRRTQSPEHNL